MKLYASNSIPLSVGGGVLALLVCCSGCSEGKKTGKDISKKSGGGLKPKTTEDIGEFKPEEGKEVVDSTVKYTNPITAPFEAFDPTKQKLSEGLITQLVEMFRATEGRYPKDYDEFKKRVIDENKMRLPTLGVGKRYQYDVAQHKLIVVMDDAK